MKPNCPVCGSYKVQKRGSYPRQRYMCTDPEHGDGHRYFYGEVSPAKVLLFDIETLPIEMYAWRLGQKIWTPDNIIRDWCVLSYSVKWLFEPSSKSKALTPKQAIIRDDRILVEDIWKYFNEADIIIAHNGDHFDVPKMNTRFLLHGLIPPAPYQTIDTRDVAKKTFGFTSNKLAYLAKYLGLEPKLETDFELWKRCSIGDKEAIEYMRIYNEQDIYTLEEVYIKMRPWIKHPNMSLFQVVSKRVDRCTHCGSDDIDWGLKHRTMARVYDAFRCNNCGAIGRIFQSGFTTSTTRTTV